MGVKVASTCLHWSQPILPHSPSSSQTLASASASAISSPSSRRRSRRGDGGALVCRNVRRLERSAFFGATSTKIYRSQSFEYPKPKIQTIERACSGDLDAFSDEEFFKSIQELTFQISDEKEDENEKENNKKKNNNAVDSESKLVSESRGYINGAESYKSSLDFVKNQSSMDFMEPPWPEFRRDPPDWSERDYIIPESIERKANSVDLPLSLRIIKRKLQWQDGFREASESACCSVNKAFSSMVFIIRELHSFTLQMRGVLFYEDLQGILARVQKEMHASFVWLFQQVFSHTPTLMVYVMILLANFTVYSMGNNAAISASLPPGSYTTTTSTTSSLVEEVHDQHKHQKFDSSTVKTFSVSSSGKNTASVGGNNGGGGKIRPVASGNDGDGRFDNSGHYGTIIPDGASQLSSSSSSSSTFGTTRETESEITEEEVNLWNSIMEEASRMQAASRDEALDQKTMERFVSPVTVKIEADRDYPDYFRTDLLYQMGLSQDPNNPLLLANYAQFLYMVVHDYDRAEAYFKRATAVEPPDAEAYSKYATFLWKVKKELWAAEETFLEAISADPTNSYYAANYAHFLWNTGGEDTCFPLTPPETTQEA